MQDRKKIAIELAKCTGCRTCELACSFHQFSHFDPFGSSIKVHRDDGKGTLEISFRSTCDGCKDEDVPFCVKYCDSGCLSIMGPVRGAEATAGD